MLILGNLIFHGIINFKGLRDKLGLKFKSQRRENKISQLIETATEN